MLGNNLVNTLKEREYGIMTSNNKVRIKVNIEWSVREMAPRFRCWVDHNMDLAPEVQWKGFVVQIPCIHPETEKLFPDELDRMFTTWDVSFSGPKTCDEYMKPLGKQLHPFFNAIRTYKLTEFECRKLKSFFPSRLKIDPRANEYFGRLLKRILEDVGYKVTVHPGKVKTSGYLS